MVDGFPNMMMVMGPHTEVDSWMTGVNRNVAGKQVRIINRYSGSAPVYRARCDAVAADGYRELLLA